MNRKVVKESLIGLVMGVGMMFAAIYLIPKETAEKVFPDSKIESVIFFISVFVSFFIYIASDIFYNLITHRKVLLNFLFQIFNLKD
jgi:membrane-bound metal-dependent hydrolase YbcI (DUF457 family)